ncbi:hypothetical protein NPIL_244081 [Nephila pilipes]|uniref:Uncharacterized protein n=1 Tax=Nephila pilipes TaxID=299642 RepID=A0A8X6NIN5_NEPPI|nr:hypothetical protein NPIL_244081 [Nephila pilipes]
MGWNPAGNTWWPGSRPTVLVTFSHQKELGPIEPLRPLNFLLSCMGTVVAACLELGSSWRGRHPGLLGSQISTTPIRAYELHDYMHISHRWIFSGSGVTPDGGSNISHWVQILITSFLRP